jgi:hypothetical protein
MDTYINFQMLLSIIQSQLSLFQGEIVGEKYQTWISGIINSRTIPLRSQQPELGIENMSISKKVISILLLSIIILGCQYSMQQQLHLTPTSIQPTSTATDIPTKTATQEPSSTATSTPDFSIEFRPLNDIDSFSQFSEINGQIILLGLYRGLAYDLTFLNLSTNEKNQITEGEWISASVSPDHQYVAYRGYTSNIMYILENNGEIFTQYINSYDYPDSLWLNEDSLLTRTSWESYPLYFYSLSKKNQIEINQFMDMTEYDVYFEKSVVHYWGFYSYHKNVYDPYFELVLYPDFSNDDIPQLSLMNMNSGEIIGTYPTYHGWGSYPTWSPDGEKLAIGLNISDKSDYYQQEICIINRNGTIEYTTTLSELFDRRFIQTIAWSSDSRYLAFYYSTSEHLYENINIEILDTENKSFISFGEFDTDNYFQIFWSPDNKYLLIQKREMNVPEEKYIPAIIEISTGNIFYLEGEYDIAGWLY